MPRSVPVVLGLLSVVLAACSAATGPGGKTPIVEVRMSDDMRYDPDTFAFSAGETVRFDVTNGGAVTHEFYIGDTVAHEEHAAEMREGGHSDDAHANPAAISVEPGDTGTLTYTFEAAGELLVGCHERGHYEAGMVAAITVHPSGPAAPRGAPKMLLVTSTLNPSVAHRGPWR